MQQYFNRAMEVLNEKFGHNVVLALATVSDGNVSVREINGYYKDGKLYTITTSNSRKVKDIEAHPQVALCKQMSRLTGMATNIGHPLAPQNIELRNELRRVFALFYDSNIDENDPKTCIIEIKLDYVETYTHYHRYAVDFKTNAIEREHYAISELWPT